MKLEEYILSKENIYLAIYEVNSFVFDKQLLTSNDRKLLNRLADPFDKDLITETITKVSKRITNILKTDELFDVKVFFKPKKMSDNNIEFRPIHTASLIDLISMVAMLHSLIYEISDGKNQLNLSNYSRLIPKNFYGNRVSKCSESLFVNWSDSYKEYTKKANDYFTLFHKTNEYKYELKLDLKQFFPSVNPIYIYNFLIDNHPVTLGKDINTLKKVIFKLLVCNITNLNTDEAQSKYYSQPIQCQNLTKGIAQGLPQSYFFGNIAMINISKLFYEKYEGKAVYYVDDSYIYTNKVTNKHDFDKSLDDLNIKLKKKFAISGASEFYDFYSHYSSFDYIMKPSYTVEIHTKEKSSLFDISKAKSGEIYLHSLSREASNMGFDINTSFSEQEDKALLSKIQALINYIDKELQNLNDDVVIVDEDSKITYKNYKDKLIRYKKFFKYRELRQQIKLKKDVLNENIVYVLLGENVNKNTQRNANYTHLIKKIKNINKKIKLHIENNDKSALSDFSKTIIDNYKDDIWQVTVDMCISYDLIEKSVLQQYIENVIKVIYETGLEECSFVKVYFSDFLENKSNYEPINRYHTLDLLVSQKLNKYSKLSFEIIYNEFNNTKFNGLNDNDILLSFDLFDADFISYFNTVNLGTDRLKRMFLNAIYSKLFKITLSDDFLLSCYDKKGISYGILRIMLYLRNPKCNLDEFMNLKINLNSLENKQKIDYAILEVLQSFQIYVKRADWIDNLIQVHKYTSDIWKNGAKHLYFYTLHNQEHAIVLIKNIIKIAKVFSYFRITDYDYYMLFISCYLHDISMVRTASPNDFLLDPAADKITYELSKFWEKSDNLNNQKEAAAITYKRLDDFYEQKIRSNHGKNSGNEIRTRDDLLFLEPSLRENVADISESHTMDARDIYFIKGEAKNKLVSLKFDKILLRLADLLDMSENRVSKPILTHNMDNISQISAFHWISHLLTTGYEINSEYKLLKKYTADKILEDGAIDETVTITVFVSLSQNSKVKNYNCPYMKIDEATIKNNEIKLKIIKNDENGNKIKCHSTKCNFLCKWFNIKNEYMVQELNALSLYFDRIPIEDIFYKTNIQIKVVVRNSTSLPSEQFEIIKNFVEKSNN